MPDPIIEKELAHDSSGPTIARLAGSRDKWRTLAEKSIPERDGLRKEVAQLKLDVIEAVKNGGAAEIAALKATIKSNAHRGKFNELATAAGVKPKALEDLWNHSGYKAEGDAPDEAAITKAIETQRTERDYLFGDAPAGDETGVETPEPGFIDGPPEPPKLVKPGVGRGQSGTQRATGDQFQMSDAQMRSPEWCFANQNKRDAAAKAVADTPTAKVGEKFAIV